MQTIQESQQVGRLILNPSQALAELDPLFDIDGDPDPSLDLTVAAPDRQGAESTPAVAAVEPADPVVELERGDGSDGRQAVFAIGASARWNIWSQPQP